MTSTNMASLDHDRDMAHLKQTIVHLRDQLQHHIQAHEHALREAAHQHDTTIRDLKRTICTLRTQREDDQQQHDMALDQLAQTHALDRQALQHTIQALRDDLAKQQQTMNDQQRAHQLALDHHTNHYKTTIQKLRRQLQKKSPEKKVK